MNHQIHLVGKMRMLVLFNERAGLLFRVSLVGLEFIFGPSQKLKNSTLR